MENFDKKLNNYARLIIEKGINANDRPLVIVVQLKELTLQDFW